MHEREPEAADRVSGRGKPDDGAARVLQLVRDKAPPSNAAVEPPLGEMSSVLEDVVRRFGSFMRRTAHRHGIDAAELDDVVQEARIRLWRALDTPEKIRQAPASYIYRTTMSAALDFLRRRRARREETIDRPPQSGPSSGIGDLQFVAPRGADSLLVENDVKDALDRAVNLLVESRRGVVRMYLAGYDREEIAELLGWSEPKTRNLLYRGLGDVRQTLEQWGYGPGARQ